MDKFTRLVNDLTQRKLNKQLGKFNSILFPFARFSNYFAGFERGKYFIISAASGVGKTKITKFLTVISVYRFCKQHNLKFKVKYFALEESEDDFWLSMISIIIYSKYGILVQIQELKSLGSFELRDNILKYVIEAESIVKDMMNYIEVFDSISNGYGIYKNVREYAEANGTYEMIKTSEGESIKGVYTPNDPDEFVLIVVDHVSLLIPETINGYKMNHWETLGYFSKEFALKGFCKKFKYTYIGVQQQEAQTERKEFTNKGESIYEKLEPSLVGLSTNKELTREADFVFGLFAPERYQIEKYRGYDITKFKDTFRTLIVLKDRWYGTGNSYVNLFMNGVTNEFFELPKAADMTNDLYDFYLKKVA